MLQETTTWVFRVFKIFYDSTRINSLSSTWISSFSLLFLFSILFCSVSLSVSLCLSYVWIIDASGFFVQDYRLREIYSLKRFSHPPSKDTERFYAEREMQLHQKKKKKKKKKKKERKKKSSSFFVSKEEIQTIMREYYSWFNVFLVNTTVC